MANLIDNTSDSTPRQVTRLSEFSRHGWRDHLRHWTLTGLSWREMLGIAPEIQTPQVQILLLHHLFLDEELSFRELLSSLQHDYRFISYSEAVTRIAENRIDDRYIAFSFDDGQKSCLRAANILNEFGAVGCFFVCPDLIEETDVSRLDTICRLRLLHPLIDFMNWRDIDFLVSQGHEIGGHTNSHVNLAQVSQTRADDEIGSCHARITKQLGSPKHFAWPYGRFSDFTQACAERVFETGFVSSASGVRGAHGASESNLTSETRASGSPGLGLYRESIVAAWPEAHIRYFLNRSAKRIFEPRRSWYDELAHSPQLGRTSCELPSTQSRSNPAAA
jgi:peptidoglycan/xylan/chitin deacetylase (PgdA/CDA1 family)